MFLFVGCGSDSKPAKTAAEKKDKGFATRSKGAASKAVMPLLTGGAAVLNSPKMEYNAEGQEVFCGLTREQFEANIAAQLNKKDPDSMEVFPGVTLKQFEARIAAEQKKSDLLSQNEVFPGVTRKVMDAKVNAQLMKTDTNHMEVFPGVTVEQMNEKIAQQQSLPREKGGLFPQSGGK